MAAKDSVSISDQQDSFAFTDAELAALKSLIKARLQGEFVSAEESNKRIEEMIAAKKAAYGL